MLLQERMESKVEKPLNGAEKTGLVLTGLATIALCYAFSIVAILALLVLLSGELLLWVGAARVGAAGYAAAIIKRHTKLLSIFLRSFWLPQPRTWQAGLGAPSK